MKTIERYVFGSFLSSFTLAFLVLTFVMTIGLMVKIVGYILDGVSMSLVGEFAAVSFPETLQWTIPLAILVSSVLVFSRMSSDSEIAAMRACGINILTVMKWPVIFALFCTIIGGVINNEIVPRGHEIRRRLKTKVTVGNGLEVLEPGRMIDDFPKIKLYFGAKEGNWLYDLVVMDYSDPSVDRMIRAAKALVTGEGTDIHLDFYNLTVDPIDAKHPGMARINRYKHILKDVLKSSHYTRRVKDFRFVEIIAKIRDGNREIERLRGMDGGKSDEKTLGMIQGSLCEMKVEFSKRLVFALASICFVLVGIPLGIRAQRKESSIGMAISLGISLGYYMIVMLMLSMESNYSLYPHMLIFLPVLVCFGLSFHFVKRTR